MGHRDFQNFGEKQNAFIYQRSIPEISARRTDSALLLKFIVITDYHLTGLDIAIVKLNSETYKIIEEKEPV